MISTRLTKFFDIEHPIILAPMTPAAGADLSEAVAAGKVKPGSLVLMIVFGNGLSWAGTVMRWPGQAAV